MCSYSWGIKCGIRDFIGRSEGRLEGGGRLWLPEWLLKGGACRWDRNREIFWTFAWPIPECQSVHILSFPINKSFLAAGGCWALLTQVNKWTLARGETIPQLGESNIHPNHPNLEGEMSFFRTTYILSSPPGQAPHPQTSGSLAPLLCQTSPWEFIWKADDKNI